MRKYFTHLNLTLLALFVATVIGWLNPLAAWAVAILAVLLSINSKLTPVAVPAKKDDTLLLG